MDNRERDLRQAAYIFIKELLHLQRNEKLLIYTDKESDSYTAKIIHSSAQQIGAISELFELNSNLEFPDMVRELTDKIEGGSFDVICELAEQYFYPTLAWKRALQLGSRIYSLGGVSADAFIRCVGHVNNSLMFKFGMALRRILKRAKSFQILTQEGTNINFQMHTNLVVKFISKLRRKQKSYVMYPTGRFIRSIHSTFMGGQLCFKGIPETMEGIALMDGYLWPPKDIGRIEDTIILQIKGGSVVEINGSSLKAKILSRWFEGHTTEIQHFGIGFNPGAELSGKIMEAERVFGYVSIGLGKYPFHTDGVIRNPSILLESKIITQDGLFTHEGLLTLQRRLLQDDSEVRKGFHSQE